MVERAGVLGVEQRLDLAIDVMPGMGVHSAFGHRTGLGVGVEADLWRGAALRRPLPLAAKAMEVVSTSGGDSFLVGAGAQLALVEFIDENGDWRQSDLLPMLGLTPVAVTYKPTDGVLGDTTRPPLTPTPPGAGSVVASIFRVQTALIVVADAPTEADPYRSNVGTVSVQGAGAGVVFEVIPAGKGRSRSGAFHIPRGMTGRLTTAAAATERGSAEISIAVNFGLGTAWQDLPVASLNDDTVLYRGDPPATPIASRADLQARVKSGSNNVDVFWLLQFRLSMLA